MNIRKIAAAATFATGAAMAFAPLAAAVPDPTLVTDTLDSEIASLNSGFELDALFAGDSADITKGGAGVFDTFKAGDLVKDAPHLVPGTNDYGQVTPLETELYGANPILAGVSSDTGPYSAYNGALTEFYNAYNVAVYAAANNGVLDTNQNDYIENSSLNHALTLGSPTAAENYLINFGEGDLKGFDAIFAPASTTVAPTDIDPTISNEIVQLNNLFELDGKLAGVYGDIVPNINSIPGNYVGFDTIPVNDLNSSLDSLVFGASSASGDPGSYDVLNGALSELFNASNVEIYSLLNGGALLPAVDIIGTHAELGTVAASVSEYLTLAGSDLAGYF
jgi:hypothetical protein